MKLQNKISRRERLKYSLGLQALVVLLLLAFSANARAVETQAAPIRIALVATGDAKIQDYLALVQGQLSTDPTLQYLDRQSIHRTLGEQELSAALADPNRAVALSRLLSADIFVVLETNQDSKKPVALGLVAFDSATGLRLVDVSLPDDPAVLKAAIDASLRAAIQKRSHAASARTLCVVSVRNANLAHDKDSLCQSIALLFQRQLITSPDVCILERQRLDHINQERTLPTATAPAPSAMLASLITADLEIVRSPDGKFLTATAYLTNPQGKSLAKISVNAESQNIEALSARLAAAVAKDLQLTSPNSLADLKLEARRFHAETEFRLSHEEYGPALYAAEAAYALDSKNPVYEFSLMLSLLQHARQIILPGKQRTDFISSITEELDPRGDVAAAFAIASRALGLRRAVFARTPLTSLELGGDEFRNTGSDRILFDFVSARDVEKGGNTAIAESSRAFRHDYRVFLTDVFVAWDGVIHKDSRAVFSLRSCMEANQYYNGWNFASDSASDFVSSFVPWTKTYLTAAETACKNGDRLFLEEVQQVRNWASGSPLPVRWTPRDYSADDRAKCDTLFASLESNPDPAVILCALSGRIAVASDATLDKPQRLALYYRARKLAEEALAKPPVAAKRIDSYHDRVYRELIDFVESTPFPTDQRGAEDVSLVHLMIDRHEFNNQALSSILWELQHCPAQKASIPQLLADAKAAADGDHARFVGCSRQEISMTLQQAKRDFTKNSAGTVVAPIAQARPLLQTGGAAQVITFEAALVEDKNAFAVGLLQSDDRWMLQGFGCPLDGSPTKPLAKVAIPSLNLNKVGGAYATVTDVCLTPMHVVVATQSDGILLFPRDASPAITLTEKDGLPSNKIRAVAFLDGKIYIGYGVFAGQGEGNYLAVYDPKTKQCDILASSRRKEKKSPFDDSAGFDIRFMLADPARHRLILNIYGVGTNLYNDPVTGLWDFTSVESKFTRLVPFTLNSSFYWHSPMDAKGIILFGSFAKLLSFDATTNKLSLIFSDGEKGPMDGGLRMEDAAFKGAVDLRPAWAVIHGDLWSGSPLARIPAGTAKPELLPQLGPNARYVFSFLYPLPDGKSVLFARDAGLWLLPLQPGNHP